MSRGRWLVAGLALLPAVLTAVRLAGWWPCDVACQGGGRYQHIGGVDALWPALTGYLLLAGMALRDAWRGPRWSTATCALAGLLAGASLFYLWVAWSLGLVCPFCLTVHGMVLLILLAVAPDAAGSAAIALLLGGLGLNAVFHHRVGADVPVLPSAELAPADPAANSLARAANANRSRGRLTAPLIVEYGYSLQCAHCAAQHGPLLDALGPALAAGRARLVLRPVVRPADGGSVWLARWSLAAAARSPADFDRFVLERLGTRAGLERDELLTLGGELPALDRAAGGGAFDGLVDDDQRTLQRLGYRGVTPFVAVVRDGRVLQRLAGDIPLAELAALVDAPPTDR